MNIKKISGFALGPLVSAVLGLLSVPLMAWIFSPADIGRMNLLQVLLSFSLLLTLLGLDQAYVREFHASNDRPALLKACFAPGFLLLCVVLLATVPFGCQLSHWLYGEDNFWFYFFTLICVMANYVSRFLSLILRMQERGLAFSMSQILPKALQLMLLGVIVLAGLEKNFLTLLWVTMASMVAVLFVYALNTRDQWQIAMTAHPSVVQFRLLLRFGLPLVFSGLAYWGLTATSILVLRANSTFGEMGIYAVTSSIAGSVAIFQSIFTVVWPPTVYKWVEQGVDMTRVDGIARQALAVVCGIFVLVGVFSWLVDYMLPVHYVSVKYLVLCAIAPVLLYTLSEITCVGIGITRRTMLTIWVTLAALFTNVFLSLWLVPVYGASGAVIANALAFLVFFVARTEASARVWRQFPRQRLYIFVSVALMLAVGTVAIGPNLPFPVALVWLGLLPMVVFFFRSEGAELLVFGRNAWGNRSDL